MKSQAIPPIHSIFDSLTLNDGVIMPRHGFGCFRLTEQEIPLVLETAVEAGYRLFDTARRYENERAVGQTLRRSGLPREELFVVSKIWPADYADPEAALEGSLRRSTLDYFDGFYLHWPGLDRDRRLRAFETLLAAHAKGRIRSVGVSNFTIGQLDDLIEVFGVSPAVNQIELHPWYPQRELVDWCRTRGIAVSAWGPIFRGHSGEAPLLAEIGARYGKSGVQTTLRWHLQKGHIVLPKSATPARIRENAAVYDFALSEEEVEAIDTLASGRHFGDDPLTFDGGDFRPLED